MFRALAIVVGIALIALPSAHGTAKSDYAAVALNVLPPGQSGNLLFPPTASDQLALDRDLDGKIDEPGAAIMDAVWPRIADALMRPTLGPLTDRLKSLIPVDDPANSGGSSYYGGWYRYVVTDLMNTSPTFCGGGDSSAARPRSEKLFMPRATSSPPSRVRTRPAGGRTPPESVSGSASCP